ncbi:HipA domain-containing protein [Roseateles sp.]|uniref:HipA domain-containing protein n=1 Tax=Roseateles sp. TaxID=1971397 RepID=UPI0031D3B451
MTRLGLWLDEREVGWLRRIDDERPGQRLTLGYLERWVAEPLTHPLATSLPLPPRGGPGEEIAGDAVLSFFDNLLPEGEARVSTFAALGLSSDDLWGALSLMGRDVAGALRVIDDEAQRDHGGRGAAPMQRHISRDELSERIRHRDTQPFAVWDGRVRGALPGRQDKLGVYVDRSDWSLVDGPQMASTHVLKPAPVEPALSDRPFNEFFCMRLAERVGLDVARVELHHVPEPVLLVQRFDRQRLKDGRVRRLHAIDACQALGVRAQEQRTVSSAELFGLLRHSPTPLVDSRALLRWLIFQRLIGNSEARAKDLAFHVDHGGLRVAAACDLACMPALGVREAHAIDMGGVSDALRIDEVAWVEFARRGGVAPRNLSLELRRMCELVRTQAEALGETLAQEVPRRVLDGILSCILPACERQVAMAASIPKTDVDSS